MLSFSTRLLIVLVLPLALYDNSAGQEAQYSQLWGKDGEKWTPQSRLPDFSFAGYRSGFLPLPTIEAKANVRDFGAKGDGESDDTQAFKKAIDATNNGALLIPAGRYKLTDILYIRKPNLVLRGEGTDKTVLFFPKGLEEIKSKVSATTAGRPTSGYSWSGGFVWFEGKNTGAHVGKVQSRAPRGANVIELDGPADKVQVGQRVEIRQEDVEDHSLVNHLYQGQTGDIAKIGAVRTAFVSRVTGIHGSRLALERPLRTDVDPKWKATVRLFEPSVTEGGLENLAFEFPVTPYGGHFTEIGLNPFAFSGAADCWARNIKIVNADSGPFLGGSNFVTLDNIVLESQRKADNQDCQGHHGITMGSDCLLSNFDFRTKFIHDITVSNSSSGNVIMQGRGVDLSFDHHKRYPHANLFTDIDLGLGTRMYKCGGGASLGRHSAAWETFWNIRAGRAQKWPPDNFGPDLMNFVGVQTDNQENTTSETGRWFEKIAPQQLQPQNLYEAQRERRLKAK
jgi:hypothetical protein